jgi:hypothetical protein
MTENILRRANQDFSWSYSRVKNFETCPRRYNEIDVLKRFKEEKTRELQDGFLVHDAMSRRIEKGVPLPPNMPFEKWAAYAMEGGGKISTEAKLAITKHFQPCEYFDKVKPVWLRTVADVLRIDGDFCHVIDWKTGKVKPDLEQLILIGTCVMAHHPQVFRIKAELVWLAYDTPTIENFTTDDIVKYWGDTMFDKVEKLRLAHNNNDFPPTRSGLCKRHCVVTTCEHCGQ